MSIKRDKSLLKDTTVFRNISTQFIKILIIATGVLNLFLSILNIFKQVSFEGILGNHKICSIFIMNNFIDLNLISDSV